jgi:hypothetical protein
VALTGRESNAKEWIAQRGTAPVSRHGAPDDTCVGGVASDSHRENRDEGKSGLARGGVNGGKYGALSRRSDRGVPRIESEDVQEAWPLTDSLTDAPEPTPDGLPSIGNRGLPRANDLDERGQLAPGVRRCPAEGLEFTRFVLDGRDVVAGAGRHRGESGFVELERERVLSHVLASSL